VLLVFGTRASVAVMAVLSYVCEVCGQQAAHRVLQRVTKVTLFFIPLFPVRTSYSDTCVNCGRTIGLQREQAELAAAQHPHLDPRAG
jgi:DNA-directed RNA polymerase subunit RPC12/RpoP